MKNPFNKGLGWLIANPLASHAVVASAETAALAGAGHLAGLSHAPALAALVVSTFYFGREAGQLEHDLKHAGTSPFMAFVGAEFGVLWGLDNLLQWLAAAGAAAVVATALTLTGN